MIPGSGTRRPPGASRKCARPARFDTRRLAAIGWVGGAAFFFSLAAGAETGESPSVPALLVAVQYTTLSAELPGKIDRIAVKEGQRFKAGQPLIAFDCVIQQAQLDEARALLAAAEKTRNVRERLLELKSSGSLEAELAAAEAAKATAKFQSAKAVVSKCAIQAPFGGRVVEQKAREHQYVQSGQAILDILDDTSLEAEFIVPSHWLASLKPEMGIEVAVDETKKTYPAHIKRIGAKVDAVSHTAKVVAEISGDHADLVAGMTGRVRMTPLGTP
nr:Membrane-fusion protein [uncultured bacterium]